MDSTCQLFEIWYEVDIKQCSSSFHKLNSEIIGHLSGSLIVGEDTIFRAWAHFLSIETF